MNDEKKEKFNQKKYIIEWKKKNKKQFKVELNIDEFIKLDKLLKKNNLSKVQFVRNGIKYFEKKENEKRRADSLFKTA